jgi:hypothetical protein
MSAERIVCTRCGKDGHRASHCPLPSSDQRTKRGDGVRTLQDIKNRCVIDVETGCWRWSMAMSNNGKPGSSMTPRVSVPPGVIGPNRSTSSTPRVAWLLSGKTLGEKHLVWRTCRCDECCAPHHLIAGTRAQEGVWMARSGHRRGKPDRTAVNLRNMLKMATPPHVVQRVEAMFAQGMLQKEISAATGLRSETLRRIRLGQHVNSSKRQRLVAQASVFALGRMAA